MRKAILTGAVLLVVVWSIVSSCKSKEEIEFEQYFIQGEILYTKHCSNCHQANGGGLALLYPPLAKSDYVDQNFDSVLCIMKFGKMVPVTVNGNVYRQPMKGIASLTDMDVAQIATYIYNSWDRKRGKVRVDEVTPVLDKCRR